MDSEKISLQDSLMTTENRSFFKRHLKLIIFIISGIIIITLVVVLIVLLTKDDDKDKDPDDDKDKDPDDDKDKDPDDDKPEEDKYGLSMEELERRTDPKYLGTKTLLKKDAKEYLELKDGDKEALKYLVKAGAILENIEYRIDDHYNIPFKKYLEEEVKKKKEQAILTKVLFDAQKGINAIDSLSEEIHLAKNHTTKPGIGVYPEDLSKEEYHEILIKMLEEGKIEEVRNITNQRSIVERDGEYLKSTDYVEYFKEDFSKMADLFEKASKVSTNQNFNDYLVKQARALRIADPELDAEADIAWADLQDTPLELTLTRENYEDELTGTFIENDRLKELLKQYNITPVPKDCLGLRVGIINEEGTDNILKIKEYLPDLAENMPYKDEYSDDTPEEEMKQTMVDADIVLLSGDVGAYRAGITLAENLPNDDKLSLQRGGGRRNVYHRQIRFVSNITAVKERLDAILDPAQHEYYDDEADHWFTIGHENVHSLGPNMKVNNLGIYKSIIEENKADMGALAFVDLLKNLSYYNETQRVKIIVTAVVDSFLKVEPSLSQAHRVRTVMQNFYIHKEGGYDITEDGKIHVNIDKVVPAANKMLAEIIRVQLDNDFNKGEKYIKDYFKWTGEMRIIGDKLQKLSSVLNCKVENELADKLLAEE